VPTHTTPRLASRRHRESTNDHLSRPGRSGRPLCAGFVTTGRSEGNTMPVIATLIEPHRVTRVFFDCLNLPNTPRSSSVAAAEMPMTTPCARASSQPSNARFWRDVASRRSPRREALSAFFAFIEGSTIARHNAHLAMLLRRTGFVVQRQVTRGVLGGSWSGGRGRGRRCCGDQHG
jgi:hypothetical protein